MTEEEEIMEVVLDCLEEGGKANMGKVKIYSNQHSAWWNPDYNGYTDNESEAGIYDMEKVKKDYPDISFNDDNPDYLVAYDAYTVVLECIDLLGRDGINAKKIAQHKLIDILPQLREAR